MSSNYRRTFPKILLYLMAECFSVVSLDSNEVIWYLVECEQSKWILTLVTGEPMEGIEEEKHTVKWNTNTQCEQAQASTQKTCFRFLTGGNSHTQKHLTLSGVRLVQLTASCTRCHRVWWVQHKLRPTIKACKSNIHKICAVNISGPSCCAKDTEAFTCLKWFVFKYYMHIQKGTIRFE